MDILLSIKPCFVDLIRSGKKIVELRKKMRDDVDRIYVYESSPIQRITGIIIVDRIEKSPIDILWEHTKEFSGVNREFFYQYFRNSEIGTGIFIKEFIGIKPVKLEAINTSPPQNYLILSERQINYIENNEFSFRV